MLIFLCVALLILYLLSIHISVKIFAAFDLESGQTLFSIALFSLKVYKARAVFKGRSLTEGDLTLLNRQRNRKNRIHVDKNTIADFIAAVKRFNFTLFTNLDVVKIHLQLEYGNPDAFKTVAYLGAMRTLFFCLTALLKSKQDIDVRQQFIPKFNSHTIKGEAMGIFRLSVADIIYGFVLSKFRKLKQRLVKAKAAPPSVGNIKAGTNHAKHEDIGCPTKKSVNCGAGQASA